jgi:hypothetical protein
MLYICNVWFFGRVVARAFLPYSFLAVFFFSFSFSFLFFSPVFCRPLPPTSLTSLGPCLSHCFGLFIVPVSVLPLPSSILDVDCCPKPSVSYLPVCVWERERGGGGDTHTHRKNERERKWIGRHREVRPMFEWAAIGRPMWPQLLLFWFLILKSEEDGKSINNGSSLQTVQNYSLCFSLFFPRTAHLPNQIFVLPKHKICVVLYIALRL